jgi:uncharacterized protein YjbJ (UPF0337 family)
MTMDQAAFEEKWKQRRSQIRVWWDKLSDNDVDQIAGRYGHLISALQAKYGFSQAQAEAEVAQRLETEPPAPSRPETTL